MTQPVDVWEALAARLDWSLRRPKVAPDIEYGAVEDTRGEPYVMVANPRDLVHFRLSVPEVDVMRAMDGTRTIGDLVVEQLESGGGLDLTRVVDLVASLESGGFLVDAGIDVDKALSRALSPVTWRSRLNNAMSTMTVQWSHAEPMVRFLYRYALRYVFAPVGLALCAVIAVLGFAAFFAVADRGTYHLTNRHLGLAFAVLVLLDLVIVFIHELGHAAALIHFGRRVKGAGVRIYFGTPAFFIESSDALMLPRGRRILQAGAGPGLELVGTSIAAILLWSFPDGGAALTLYQFVLINYFVLFLNVIPLLELDGYWMLSDWLRMPDLRPDSLAFVRYDLWSKLRHRESFSRGELGLAAYGTLGVAFTIWALVSALYFWRKIFGNTVLGMIHAGPAGWIGLALLVLLLAGPALRALGLAVLALARALRRRYRAVRFRWETSWRVDAAELIDDSAVFGDLPVEVLNDLAGRVELLQIGRGQPVFRQGERALACYVVRSGTLEVVEEAPDEGPVRTLRALVRGDTFGELALLQGSVRTATVRATSDAEVYVLGKSAVDRLLADVATLPEYVTTWQQCADLAALPAFEHLDPGRLTELVQRGRWIDVAPGQAVVRQGEEGDAFYVVSRGQLAVDEDGHEVRTLHAGDHFGEVALLLDIMRTATVRAVTPSRVFRLEREDFDVMLAEEFRRGRLHGHTPERYVWDH
ncbi:MAG TPA: cyclic nucleotide-binding domain-containing protein [Actinomycetes bacterium]|nr:cyclic nucleotide-binding domain-containing protein [Actinomycetes bacterium]